MTRHKMTAQPLFIQINSVLFAIFKHLDVGAILMGFSCIMHC